MSEPFYKVGRDALADALQNEIVEFCGILLIPDVHGLSLQQAMT